MNKPADQNDRLAAADRFITLNYQPDRSVRSWLRADAPDVLRAVFAGTLYGWLHVASPGSTLDPVPGSEVQSVTVTLANGWTLAIS